MADTKKDQGDKTQADGETPSMAEQQETIKERTEVSRTDRVEHQGQSPVPTEEGDYK